MFLESFDNYEERKAKAILDEKNRLKKIQDDLVEARNKSEEQGFNRGYNQAIDEKRKEMEEKISDINYNNNKEISSIIKKIKDNVDEQSNHYAKILKSVLTHFMTDIVRIEQSDNIEKCISDLLKSCDKRHIKVITNPKNNSIIDDILQDISDRVDICEDENMDTGKIILHYRGGSAEVDFDIIEKDIVRIFEDFLDIS